MSSYKEDASFPSDHKATLDPQAAAFRALLLAVGHPPKLRALDTATHAYAITASEDDIDGPIHLPTATRKAIERILGFPPIGVSIRATSSYVSVGVTRRELPLDDLLTDPSGQKGVKTVTLSSCSGNITVEPDYANSEVGEFPETQAYPLPPEVEQEIPMLLEQFVSRTFINKDQLTIPITSKH